MMMRAASFALHKRFRSFKRLSACSNRESTSCRELSLHLQLQRARERAPTEGAGRTQRRGGCGGFFRASARSLRRFALFQSRASPPQVTKKRPTNLLIGDDLDAVVLPDTDASGKGEFQESWGQKQVSKRQSFHSFPCASNRCRATAGREQRNGVLALLPS